MKSWAIACLLLFLSSSGGYCEWMPPKRVNVNGKWGFKDQDSYIVIEPTYDKVGQFSEDMASVWLGGKCGYIDIAGQQAIDFRYDDCGDFRSPGTRNPKAVRALAIVKVGGKFGLIDPKGGVIADTKHEAARLTECGFYFVLSDDTSNLYYSATDGKVVKTERRPGIDLIPASGGPRAVNFSGKYGFLDKTNKLVIKPAYEKAMDFSEGRALVKMNGKWGYIDAAGATVADFIYEDGMSFANGMARVKRDGKWGFIDRSGKIAIEPRYDYCWDFSGGKAKVRTADGAIAFINSSGDVLNDR